MTEADLRAVAPALILAASAIVTALLAIPMKRGAPVLAWLGAAASLGATAAAVASGLSSGHATAFGGTIARDGASLFFVTLIGTTAAALLLLGSAGPRRTRRSADEVALVLFSASGGALAVSAADLLVLFVGLALLTLPLYVLTGRRHTDRGDDRASRHFLLGSAGTAAALYGVALLYTATGETGYASVGRATHNPLYLAGLALVLAGLAGHVVLAPAHRWSILVNVAAIGALLRLAAATGSGEAALDWEVSLAAFAALALAIAAVASLAERRVRWLVAYAAISQLGYVAVAAAASAVPGAAFVLALYVAVAVGSFGVLATLPYEEPVLADLAGLARQRPLLVLGLGVVVLGLIGMPPTAGFLAKLYVYEAAVRAQLLWLVALGALATVASAASYVRLVLACFAPPRLDAVAPARARVGTALVLIVALAIVIAGVAPGPLLDVAQTVRF
jgi:NADH-quinone oxidoreductase subunit N